MQHVWCLRRAAIVTTIVATLIAVSAHAALSPDLEKALANSKYVYISSTRKDGSMSKPAEIWFMYQNGAVYVASPPTTWRVRRIKAGRPQAKIAVGSPTGPSFTATGTIVNDPSLYPVLFETYAKKYPDGWSSYEDKFRSGLKDGSRVLIKYTPST